VDGVRYLDADLFVKCDSSEHQWYQTFAWGMVVVFPVGLPIIYFIMLYPHRHHIAIGDTHHIKHLSFFYQVI
jgi:hypothetical protein